MRSARTVDIPPAPNWCQQVQYLGAVAMPPGKIQVGDTCKVTSARASLEKCDPLMCHNNSMGLQYRNAMQLPDFEVQIHIRCQVSELQFNFSKVHYALHT